ncbi:ATP-binding protein [Caldithrix abyssi]
MSEKIILSVPAHLDYLAIVESFVELVGKHIPVQNKELLAQQLRFTVNEAFVNILQHTPRPPDGMVVIHFEFDPPTLYLRFPDRGKGLKIKDQYPPYSSEMVGDDYLILKTLGGELYGYIENPRTVKLWFKEVDTKMDKKQIIAQLKPGGMGLSIIVKFMDEVRFVKDEEEGHYLEIKKYLTGDQESGRNSDS